MRFRFSTGGTTEHVKILLIDENPTHLNFITNCLKAKDKILLQAYSSTQALEFIKHHEDIALVLLAVGSDANTEGYTLATQIRLKYEEMPIIFLTAETNLGEEQIFKGYSSGAVDYLIKPININILLSKVDVFIRLHQQKRLLYLANQKLKKKFRECRQAQNILQAYQAHLETEVSERTQDLKQTNQQLQQEIAGHLETERALAKAEARFRNIFENILEGIFQSSPDGHYLVVNPALVKMYGYDSAEELMMHLNDIGQQLYVQPQRRVEFMQLLETQDTVLGFESEVYRKNGEIIWISENARAVRDKYRQLFYYEGSVENITERKHAELALQRTIIAYRRFVPHDFLRLLNKSSIVDVELNDHVLRQMTILFSDIRSFTALSERLTPQQNFEFINEYLNLMGPVVRDFHGFIDKYIGDSIMALFDRTADDAVQAAIVMLQTLSEFNTCRLALKQEPIQVGIGINTGSMMLGTIGEHHRMEGTVISDAVNLASRIESLTKLYGVSLLISENTFQSLRNPQQYDIRFIDKVQVKGKSKEVIIYEVFQADSLVPRRGKSATRDIFEQACLWYHQGYIADAEEVFTACLDHNPDDTVAKVYKERCLTKRHSKGA